MSNLADSIGAQWAKRRRLIHRKLFRRRIPILLAGPRDVDQGVDTIGPNGLKKVYLANDIVDQGVFRGLPGGWEAAGREPNELIAIRATDGTVATVWQLGGRTASIAIEDDWVIVGMTSGSVVACTTRQPPVIGP